MSLRRRDKGDLIALIVIGLLILCGGGFSLLALLGVGRD